MSIYELAERDLRKAENSLAMAKKRPNVPVAELEHIENLCRLRKEILEIMLHKKVIPIIANSAETPGAISIFPNKMSLGKGKSRIAFSITSEVIPLLYP